VKRVVVDASVVVKWLLPDRDGEEDVEEALRVLRLVQASELTVHQPPHWLSEAAAVITRLSPDTAMEDIEDLCALNFEVRDTEEVYLTACELSLQLKHHLFDTLYHAVALSLPDAVLITADREYFRKAGALGYVVLLGDIGGEFGKHGQ
jgi:predicted nucleic acid-binding protein